MTTEFPRDDNPDLSQTHPTAEGTPNGSGWPAIVAILRRQPLRPSFLAIVSLATIAAFGSLVIWCWQHVLRMVTEHRLPLDPIEHLAGLACIVLVVGAFLVMVSAWAKATLDSDRQKRQKLQSRKEERDAAKASDPCYGLWAINWRRLCEYGGHELGTALIVAAAVSLLFEVTVRLAETAERQKEHSDFVAEREKEHGDMVAAMEQQRVAREKERQLDKAAREEELREESAELEQEREDHEVQRQQEQKDLKENVFRAVFGHTIDPEVVKEVVQSVFESPLTRYNLEINCHLYRADETGRAVRARVDMRYHLKNALYKTVALASDSAVLSEGQVRQPQLRAGIEPVKPGEPNTDCFTSFAVLDEQLKPIVVLSEGNLKEARGKAMDLFTKEFQQRQAATLKGLFPSAISDDALDWAKVSSDDFEYYYGARRQQVTIKRLEIQPGQAVVVDFSYEQTKRESDNLAIYTQHPTTNSQVTVSKGQGAGDLHVAVQSTSRHQPVRLMPNVQPEGPGQTYQYQSTAAFLPGQLVEVSWYPRSTEIAKRDSGKGNAAGR
jgi:hypothetical protein